jgi:transcriptional regulator
VYVPQKHAVDDDEAWQIVRDAGSGSLVVATPDGLASVFVPVVVSDDRRTITSHLAKANSWWRTVHAGDEVLALFLAASAYVTPSYYPSRHDNPGVVPTWNYVAAEVRGRVRLHDDPTWKLKQVRTLTQQFERGRDPEWRVDDLDESYRERQLAAIVGIEIEVTAIEGKAKLSQNRPAEDQRSVQRHLESGTLEERSVALRMKSTAPSSE